MIRFIVPFYTLVTAVMAATFLIIVVHFGAKSQKIYKPNLSLPLEVFWLEVLFSRYPAIGKEGVCKALLSPLLPPPIAAESREDFFLSPAHSQQNPKEILQKIFCFPPCTQ